MTEEYIQRHFERMFRTGSEIVIPNAKVFGWESDILRVTKHGHIHEYDIKLNTKDLYRDSKKVWKHQRIAKARNCPNTFSYIIAFPPTDYAMESLGRWTGVVRYDPEKSSSLSFTELRRPCQLHDELASPELWYKLLKQFNNKFWKKAQQLLLFPEAA